LYPARIDEQRIQHSVQNIQERRPLAESTRSDNKVRQLATVCLPWQQWTETSVWFDDVGISAFHSCVVVDLCQSLSKCVLVCRREKVVT
jgi:hypothetical protein